VLLDDRPSPLLGDGLRCEEPAADRLEAQVFRIDGAEREHPELGVVRVSLDRLLPDGIAVVVTLAPELLEPLTLGVVCPSVRDQGAQRWFPVGAEDLVCRVLITAHRLLLSLGDAVRPLCAHERPFRRTPADVGGLIAGCIKQAETRLVERDSAL
jgi:hypothetical protein